MRIVIYLAVVLALGGSCFAASLSERLRPYIGKSMEDWIRGTGLSPADMYDAAEGQRTFIVPVSASTVNLPIGGGMTVSRSAECKYMIDTALNGKPGFPSSWRIVQITTQGPCGY